MISEEAALIALLRCQADIYEYLATDSQGEADAKALAEGYKHLLRECSKVAKLKPKTFSVEFDPMPGQLLLRMLNKPPEE